MHYLSSQEIAKKWKISQRWVVRLARDGRIPGTKKIGKNWMIPENAERPADGRTEKGKQHHQKNDGFRFPLYVNFDINSYSPPLSEEESELRQAQIHFYACRFDEAKSIFDNLANTSQNRYIRISALYFKCYLSIMLNGSETWEYCQEKLMSALTEDFPHQKEMELFVYMLGSTLSINDALVQNFFLDKKYSYHPSVYYNLFNYALVAAGNGVCSQVNHMNFDYLEVICKQMAHDGYAFEEQELHGILISIYQLQGNYEMTCYHIKKIFDIAQKKELYWLAAIYKTFYPAEYQSVLSEYPEDFIEKITKISDYFWSRYVAFIGQNNSYSLYKNLSSKDYQYVFFATQGYTNKEVARIIHSTESNVANKYHEIYTKLGINSKAQLIEIFYQTQYNAKKC